MPDPKRLLDGKLEEIEEVIKTSPSKVCERLSSLLGQYPSHPRVLTLMSHANVLMEDYGTAKSYAKRAVLMEPSNITAKYIIG